MIKNLLKKSIQAFIIILIILLLTSNSIYASDVGNAVNGADSFISNGTSQGSIINETALSSASGTIYNMLLIIGIVVAVIIGAMLGIQLMLASVEDKAKVKETLIPYVAGCVVVFGAFGIWKLLIEITSSF